MASIHAMPCTHSSKNRSKTSTTARRLLSLADQHGILSNVRYHSFFGYWGVCGRPLVAPVSRLDSVVPNRIDSALSSSVCIIYATMPSMLSSPPMNFSFRKFNGPQHRTCVQATGSFTTSSMVTYSKSS